MLLSKRAQIYFRNDKIILSRIEKRCEMVILHNFPLVAAMIAIFISQLTKIPVAYILKRPVTLTLMFSTGGMPSSHSAGVTALITALIIEYGWASPFTAIAVTFGVLVMFDSMGVRRQSGEQGIIINELIREFQLLTKSLTGPQEELEEEIQEELENNTMQSSEFLGHKPIEVFFGILYGILLTGLLYFLFYA